MLNYSNPSDIMKKLNIIKMDDKLLDISSNEIKNINANAVTDSMLHKITL